MPRTCAALREKKSRRARFFFEKSGAAAGSGWGFFAEKSTPKVFA
jgi:hypothetical protein